MALTINEAVGVMALQHNMNFEAFRTFSEWLGSYSYIPPVHRYLSVELIDSVKNTRQQDELLPIDIFKTYLLADILFTCYSRTEQHNMLGFILAEKKRNSK